jgi:hypothetical protein
MTIGDLQLLKGVTKAHPFVTINLDRRYQTYTSDVLLVYELLAHRQHPNVIAKLQPLRSNSIAISALVLIWAMIDGLAVSIRWCDWDVNSIIECAKLLLTSVCSKIQNVYLNFSDNGYEVTLTGAIQGTLRFDLVPPPFRGKLIGMEDSPNLFVMHRDQPASSDNSALLDQFLEFCLESMSELLSEYLAEPELLDENTLRCPELIFDDYEHLSGM